MKEDINSKLNDDEIKLVSLSDAEMLKGGYYTYLTKTMYKIYPIARLVAEMSPNERIIFEDGLAKFREVLNGNEPTR